MDGLILYTFDGMQHRIFGCKFIKELYCVLDHVWRAPTPKFMNDKIPPYADPEYIREALEKQGEARHQVMKYRANAYSKMCHAPELPHSDHPHSIPSNPNPEPNLYPAL